jgi:O-antigen/teichoic acid export membrane protein
MDLKPFIASIVKYAPSQMAQGIIGLVSIPIFTRAYSPAAYGDYSIAMTSLMILVILMGWLPMSIIRYYAGYHKQNKLGQFHLQVIISSLISMVAIDLVYFFLVSIISKHFSPTLVHLMRVTAGLFFVTAVFEVCISLLMAKGFAGWYSIFSTSRVIASFVISLLFIYAWHLKIECLLYANIIATAICIPWLYRKAVERIPPGSSTSMEYGQVKQMIHYSLPLVVANIASWILSVSDRYILQFFRGADEVGVYSVAYNLTDRSLMLIVSLFMMASAPILVNAWENLGEEACKEYVHKFTRCYLILCLPACSGLCVLSRSILSVMTTEKYIDGHIAIPFVAIGIFFFGLQSRYQSGLILHKKTARISFAIVGAGILNLVLNVLSVPFYGYKAAAVNTLISYLALLIGMIFLAKRYFEWPFPMKSLIRVSLSAGAMTAVVALIDSNGIAPSLNKLAATVSIGAVIYFGGLVFLKEFSSEEVTAGKSSLLLMIRRNRAKE